ncbi:concanavalin A-like lectin/glucanase domain-containing protein [Cantharellus anzutake]|uniref:concanavalin A-like lectin/glucanase domain-containing protein n=1 Tax=Cantharellus anzutake TaxID=1750568 RepID=UPI0019075184|nr:concanavalin A-like lectin/glucanase domain-containing protein [Cantharellus anzutake]KAF8342350.1 concanavalin A-like lectin/glucanase domain-containing protein [Cantharellus anzutake]
MKRQKFYASALVASFALVAGSSSGLTDHRTFRARGGNRLLSHRRQNPYVGHHHHFLEHPHQSRYSPPPQPQLESRDSPKYVLVEERKGNSFFDGFDFFTSPDPTHGMVNYLDQNAARNAGLVYVQPDGTVVMKVDNSTNLPYGALRNSVRISSIRKYQGGLFIFDVQAGPFGCGVWPAFWTVGPDWPLGGEIDIFEGVHYGPTNQMTLHTAPGCSTDTNSTVPNDFRVPPSSAGMGTSNCGPSPNNGGCYFIDNNPTSYGTKFRDAGGAVMAMEWSNRGIRIWNFPRNHVPFDLKAQKPVPALWSSAYLKAAWTSTACPPSKYFRQHSIVIDTTLCGDWAGTTYTSAGCPGTCTQQIMTAGNFDNAVWKINAVAVYTQK